MSNPALTQLIPIQEMTPGAVGAIRNQIINSMVDQVSRELVLPPDKLVVRDVRFVGDLAMYAAAVAAATAENWEFEPTAHAVATWHAACGANTMADQRYVALYGIRNGAFVGIHATIDDSATTVSASFSATQLYNPVGQIKINVGGADKVIWDARCIAGYRDLQAAFAPSAVIIPQNTAYRIYYLFTTAAAGVTSRIQLIGVTVEPRGKVISP